MNRNQLHSAAFMFAAMVACALILAMSGCDDGAPKRPYRFGVYCLEKCAVTLHTTESFTITPYHFTPTQAAELADELNAAIDARYVTVSDGGAR